MVPQFRQGFLQPAVAGGTGKPQRLQAGGEAGTRGRGEVLVPRRTCESRSRNCSFCSPASRRPRFPALSNPICSGEERIRHSLHPDCGVESVAAVDDGGIRQRQEFGLNGVQQRG
jgi:hypothetical protein